MRKTLAVAAIVALVALWVVTAQAIYGAPPLPPRIPTHFDISGNVNGWGEPRMLWLLPFIATLIFGLMTLVSFFPHSFNYPMRVTPAMRPRVENITLAMIAWLRAEVACIFLWIQFETIESAREGANRLSPWFLPLLLVVVFGTITWHFVALLRAGRDMREEAGG